jgi:hypothetical protein
MSDVGWETVRVLGLSVIAAVVTVAVAYIAARYKITKKPDTDDTPHN